MDFMFQLCLSSRIFFHSRSGRWDGGMRGMLLVARLSLDEKKGEGVRCGGLCYDLRLRMEDCEIPI